MSGRSTSIHCVRHDVVDQMRINRRAHRPAAGLDVGEERQQHRQIVALGKALFLHQALPLEHGIGKQKTVGRHQVDLGPRRPARQQRLQHARGGRFADRDRAGDADDVGHLAVADVEELALRLVEPMGGVDIDRQQARQRQVDVLDLQHVEAVMHRTQPLEFARLQRHRRVVAQPRPLLAGEDAVGIILLFGGPDIHELPLRLSRACATPFPRARTSTSAAPARPRPRRA